MFNYFDIYGPTTMQPYLPGFDGLQTTKKNNQNKLKLVFPL